jgi:hypothetical protein
MANQAIYAPFRVLDANGDPVAGALATFYVSGTTTLLDIFSDEDGTIAALNPVEADGDGYLPQRYFTGSAKVVITDADGGTLSTLDPCPVSITTGAGAGQTTFDPTANVPADNVQDAIETVDDNWRAAAEDLQPADDTLTSLAGLSLVAGDIFYATAADTVARLAKGTAHQVLQINAGATAPEWSNRLAVAVLTGETAQNTDGADVPTGGFAALTINTEKSDSIGVSLASNQITFATAGTYLIFATITTYNNSGGGRSAQVRLRNVTTAATVASGSVGNTQTAAAMTLSVAGAATVAAANKIEFQADSSGASLLQARAGNYGPEVGAIVIIIRIA